MKKCLVAAVALLPSVLAAEEWQGSYGAEAMPTQSVPVWIEDLGAGTTIRAEITEAEGRSVLRQTLSQSERGGWRIQAEDLLVPGSGYTLEMRVRVAEGSDYLAGLELRSPEIGWVQLRIAPTKLEVRTIENVAVLPVDGAEFHTYRLVTSGDEARLFIDDGSEPSLIIRGGANDRGTFLGFGDYGGLNGEGAAEYEFIRWASEARPPVLN